MTELENQVKLKTLKNPESVMSRLIEDNIVSNIEGLRDKLMYEIAQAASILNEKNIPFACVDEDPWYRIYIEKENLPEARKYLNESQ